MKVYYLPLEPLEERYTEQMYRWIVAAFEKRELDYFIIPGQPLSKTTEGHQFLNWPSRVHYAATQMQQVAERFSRGKVADGDVFFIPDLWHPGVEFIGYMAELSGIKVRLFGIQHAGPFDITDQTNQLLSWGKYLEACWYDLFEGVFFGSQYLVDLVVQGLRSEGLYTGQGEKFHVTGQVWDASDCREQTNWDVALKYPVVIWPHRLAPEKNPRDFYRLAEALAPEFPEVEWWITSSRLKQQFIPPSEMVKFKAVSKPDYYGILAKAQVMVSTAFQENYGYTIREATALDTPILCPDRACYPEMIFSSENLYTGFDQLVNQTRLALKGELPVAHLLEQTGINGMIDIILEGS